MANVFAFAESRGGEIRKAGLEAVTAARQIADQTGGGEVHALLAGAPGIAAQAQRLAEVGADVVYVVEHAGLAQYDAEALAATAAERIRAGGYRAAVFSATSQGKDLSPRPPLTTTGASPRSSFPLLPSRSSVTRTREAPGSAAGWIASTRPAFAFGCGGTAPRRTDSSAGDAVIASVPITLPVYIGWRMTIASPSTAMAVASGASGARSLAATRGLRSFPCAVALNTAAR